MAACGIDLDAEVQLHEVDFYTSHEALLLGYEEALTRRDSLTGDWYDCSAHLLWVGERTRQSDGAHVEFLSGIHNPVGVKIGPDASPEQVVDLCRRLDPGREPGPAHARRAAWARDKVAECLPPLLRAVTRAGHPVVWACDPMHGNTFVHESGYKTRHFDDVMPKSRRSSQCCRAEDVWPGGVHVELTGDDVTECLGGAESDPRRRPRRAVRDRVRPAAQRPPVARPGVPPRRARPPLSARTPAAMTADARDESTGMSDTTATHRPRSRPERGPDRRDVPALPGQPAGGRARLARVLRGLRAPRRRSPAAARRRAAPTPAPAAAAAPPPHRPPRPRRPTRPRRSCSTATRREPLRGAAARIVENMEASLAGPDRHVGARRCRRSCSRSTGRSSTTTSPARAAARSRSRTSSATRCSARCAPCRT